MSDRHPNDYDLYTPITPEVLQLLVRMRKEHGSWREVAAISGTRTRVLRRLYRLERKAVSMVLLDRLCTTTEVGSIDEFTWFEANDLVTLGIWDEIEFFDGTEVQGLKGLSLEERKRRRLERIRVRKKLARLRRRREREVKALFDEGQPFDITTE